MALEFAQCLVTSYGALPALDELVIKSCSGLHGAFLKRLGLSLSRRMFVCDVQPANSDNKAAGINVIMVCKVICYDFHFSRPIWVITRPMMSFNNPVFGPPLTRNRSASRDDSVLNL